MRKGGISESAGPGVFDPEHAQFWLFPTWVHQSEQGLRHAAGEVAVTHRFSDDGSISICALVRIDVIGRVESERHAIEIGGVSCFHRRDDSGSGFTIGGRVFGSWARVWRREPGFTLVPTPEQAGCKTWVTLDEPVATTGLTLVVKNAEWDARRERLESILGCH